MVDMMQRLDQIKELRYQQDEYIINIIEQLDDPTDYQQYVTFCNERFIQCPKITEIMCVLGMYLLSQKKYAGDDTKPGSKDKYRALHNLASDEHFAHAINPGGSVTLNQAPCTNCGDSNVL